MAKLLLDTFNTKLPLKQERGKAIQKDITGVLGRVKMALENITGTKGRGVEGTKDGKVTGSLDYPVIAVPGRLAKLNADEDRLRDNFKLIWQMCTIEFAEGEGGAEVFPKINRMILGPLLWSPNIDVANTEKIIIHEFLHLALDDDWQTGKPFGPMAQHQQINPIIRRRLGYGPPVNPGNPAEEG
jgi:hypothetical protein